MAIRQYIDGLSLSSDSSAKAHVPKHGKAIAGHKLAAAAETSLPEDLKAAVDVGSLLSFVDGVDGPSREDILFSVQLAQRAASGDFDRFSQTRAWYSKYIEVLEATGWAVEQFGFALQKQTEGNFRMDKAALAIITAIATQNQLAVLKESISALEKLAEGDGAITLFDFHTTADMAGNFQIGAVQKSANGSLSMALGAFYFRSSDRRRKFLFFKWGKKEVNFWTAAQKMTFNKTLYDKVREGVKKKLGENASEFIGGLILK